MHKSMVNGTTNGKLDKTALWYHPQLTDNKQNDHQQERFGGHILYVVFLFDNIW